VKTDRTANTSQPPCGQGTWPADCLQRAFVNGAAWWQYYHNGEKMFPCERDEAEAEAISRYGEPHRDMSTEDVR
jgi:hypothetical protein